MSIPLKNPSISEGLFVRRDYLVYVNTAPAFVVIVSQILGPVDPAICLAEAIA
jgi:hypothetical protein